MKRMKLLLAIVALGIFQDGFSQDKIDTSIRSAVVVHKDPRVDVLVRKQASNNASIKKATSRTARGYRLMVVNTSKRDEAISAKSKVYNYYPELKSYLVYQSPFFKVKVGNFRTKEEAEKYRKRMNSLFPKGVFIVNDTIEVKPEAD